MSEGGRPRRKSNALDRRPLRFWEPFNVWWRSELERTGKRATADDITRWYQAQSGHAWGPEKPSLQETRTHAKCLRSVSSVRDYFREYRAKKKHEQSEMEMDEEDEDDRRSRSTSKRASGSRSKMAHSHSTACYSDAHDALPLHMAHSNEHGFWGSGHFEGAASGLSTAAAGAAGGSEGQIMASQAMAAYGQQQAALDLAGVHPGALDAVWEAYQPTHAAATAVTTEGPALPSMPAMQAMSQYQEQHAYAGAAADTAAFHNSMSLWQQHAAVAGAAAPAPTTTLTSEPPGQGQQHMQQHSPGFSIPTSAAAAGRISLSSLLSPGLQRQLAATFAYQTEMPVLSPRPQQGAALASIAAGRTLEGSYCEPALQASSYLGQPRGTPTPAHTRSQLQDAADATTTAGGMLKLEAAALHQQQAQMPAPLWSLAEQQFIAQQYKAATEQGHFAGAASAYGGSGGQTGTGQQHMQQRPCAEDPMHDWLLQVQAYQQLQTTTTTTAAAAAAGHEGGNPDMLQGSSRARAGMSNGADAPASAPQQHCLPARSAVSTQLDRSQGPGGVAHSAERTPTAAAATSTQAPAGPAVPSNADPSSTLHGIIPASLLAAVPLPGGPPGCAGHSTVDSILQQLEAGRSPGSHDPAGHGNPTADQQRQTHQRLTASALLEGPAGLAHAPHRLSQVLDNLSLPQQRLSLYAMGSGMLDMLTEGMDLDTFLGSGDLGHPPAAGGCGGGGMGGDDTIAPIAPGSRVSIRWLRTSGHIQVPEHWQQQIQTLQDAPFRGGGGGPAAAAATAWSGAPPSQAAGLQMGRASSAGIEALAEAAAAALAARPGLLAGTCAGAPPAAQTAGAAAQLGPAADAIARAPDAEEITTAEDAAQAVNGTSERKRVREPQAGALTTQPSTDMGPPARGPKRACGAGHAGLGIALSPNAGDRQAAANPQGRTNPQVFKFVLDLATPKAVPAPQLLKQQLQQPKLESLQGPEHQQGYNPAIKHPFVLDLRPEDKGATSQNTLNTPRAITAQSQPQVELKSHADAQQPAVMGPHLESKKEGRGQTLMLPPLLSPGSAGVDAAGPLTARGALHCGPATAASTTGAPPTGPGGAELPAPAISHMAAAMAAAAGAVRPQAVQHIPVGGITGTGPKGPMDQAKHLLPAMHEIERMI